MIGSRANQASRASRSIYCPRSLAEPPQNSFLMESPMVRGRACAVHPFVLGLMALYSSKRFLPKTFNSQPLHSPPTRASRKSFSGADVCVSSNNALFLLEKYDFPCLL